MLPLIGPLTLPTFFVGFVILLLFKWFTYKPEPEDEDSVLNEEKVEAKKILENGQGKVKKVDKPKENGVSKARCKLAIISVVSTILFSFNFSRISTVEPITKGLAFSLSDVILFFVVVDVIVYPLGH